MPTSKFNIGEFVWLDDYEDLKCRIIAITFRSGTSVQYEIEWINNGQLNSAWVLEYRLSKWNEND